MTKPFVVVSELTVPPEGIQAVRDAFEDRLGAVDSWPGFRGLEVWEATDDSSHLVMVSWWDNEETFRAYMRSPDHRRSHARIPSGEHRPSLRNFQRYEVVAR